MTLCKECVAVADRDMVARRVEHQGIPDDEDTHWSLTYNEAHAQHAKSDQ